MTMFKSIILILVICFNISSHAEGFADYLYSQGLYKYAIMEYEREAYGSYNKFYVNYKLIDSYIKIGDYKNALKKMGNIKIYDEKLYGLSIDLFKNSGRFRDALNFYSLNRFGLKKDTLAKIYFYNKLYMFNDIKQSIHSIDIKNRDEIFKLVSMPSKTKSYLLAGLFSIVPGAGYIYTQRYGDALFANILIGPLSLLGYKFYSYGYPGRAYASWGVASFFYISQIYGSFVSVKLYNKRMKLLLSNKISILLEENF